MPTLVCCRQFHLQTGYPQQWTLCQHRRTLSQNVRRSETWTPETVMSHTDLSNHAAGPLQVLEYQSKIDKSFCFLYDRKKNRI